MKIKFPYTAFLKAIIILITWLPNLSLAIETNFPDLGVHQDTRLETKTENVIGDMVMQRIYGSDFLISDPVVNEYLNELALKFGHHARLTNHKLHFFGVNSPELNAFAFFGGHVAVHSGLILAVDNESQLAAVLAHETAHIMQRHLARMMDQNRKMMPLTFAELLAALAIGAFGSPEAGAHLATAAMAGHVQQMINFTREHEQEADRIGIQLLSETNYDPTALANVFQRMKQQTQYRQTPPEYLLTHPIFESRIADAQNRAAMLPHQNAESSLFFHLVRARLETSKEENSNRRLNRIKEILETGRYQNKIAAEYGYALALLQTRHAKDALPLLRKLVAENPNEWVIALSLAEAEQNVGSPALALSQTTRLLQLYPNNYPILLQEATLLLRDKQPDQVIKLLTPQRKEHWSDPIIHQMLAEAYSLRQQPVELHRAQAEWRLARGEFKEAYQQLDLALEYAGENSRVAKEIKLRKNAMMDMQEQQRSIKL